MRAMIILFLALYFPLVTHTSVTTQPTAVDPEVAQYAVQVQAVSQNYLSIASELARLLAALATNPPLVRQPSFNEELAGLTRSIRQNTNYLASLHSPAPVESIHEDLVRASDIFDIAAYELDQFVKGHNYDHVANAYEFIGAGLGLWQAAIGRLTALVTPPS